MIDIGLSPEERARREEEERLRKERELQEQLARQQEQIAEETEAAEQRAAEAAQTAIEANQAGADAGKAASESAAAQAHSSSVKEDKKEETLNAANPETPKTDAGVRSRGLPRITQEDKTDAQYMRFVREGVMDTSFKVRRYDVEDGYKDGIPKAHLASKLVGHAADLPTESESGNIVNIRYGSVKNKEQGFALLMTGSDDKAKVDIGKSLASHFNMPVGSFLAEAENFVYDKFGRQMFSSPYSNAAKIRVGNDAIKNIGLTDVSGATLNVNTATVPDFIRAARMDPSGETAEELYKCAKTLSQVPGSIWYGYDVQQDMFSFVESSDLTKKQYDDAVKKFNASFSYTDGFDEANLAKYLKNYEDIVRRYGADERVFGYFFRELNDSYTTHTGLNPMTREMADKALAETIEQRKLVSETATSEENAEKGILDVLFGWVSGAADWIKGLGKAEKPEVQGEQKTVDEILSEINASEVSSSSGSAIATGGTVNVGGQEAVISKPIASTGMPSVQEMFPDGGAEAEPEPWFDNPLGISEEKLNEKKDNAQPAFNENAYIESLAYDPEMTDEQAWVAHRNGYRLAPENLNQIGRFVNNPDIIGLVHGELNKDTAIDSIKKHGWYLGDAANKLRSSNAPPEVKAKAEMALMQLAYEIYEEALLPSAANERQGNKNMYDHIIEFNAGGTYMGRIDEIKKSLNSIDTGYGEAAVEAVDEREARMEGYTQQMIAGNGNQEIADALAEYHEYDWVDLNMDDMYNSVRKEAAVDGKLFGADGTYWAGDSPAATTYNTIIATMGKQEAMRFRRDMSLRTIDLAEGYARAAHNIGVTTEEFLSSAGIKSTEQLADIAFSCMETEGNAIANDPNTPEYVKAIVEQDSSVQGYVISDKEKLGVMGSYGVTDWQEGYASAAYNMVSLADYNATVQNNKDYYIGEYGPIMGPAMYRRDINLDIAAGRLSKEQAELLQADMARTYDIFDLGYEVNPDGVKGKLQEGMTNLQNKLEVLDAVIGTLTPELQREIRSGSSLVSNSLAMGTQIVSAGVLGATGASANAARLVGTLAGHSAGIWDDAFDQNRKGGMRRGHAALSALFDTTVQSYIESLNVGSFTELFFGDVDLTSAIRMLRNNPVNAIKAVGGLLAAGPVGEGVEEMAQGTAQTIMDAFDPLVVAYENGQKVTWSMAYDSLRSCFNGMTGEEFLTELAQQFKGGTAMGAFYSVLGTAFTGLRSVTDIKAFNKYETVKMATQIAEGTLPATKVNLGKLYDSLDRDMADPAFRKYMNRGSAQAHKDRQVVTAMLEGTELDTFNGAVDHAEKAKEYGEKKVAAQNAINTAQGRWVELRQQVMNGNIDAVPAMTTAQQQLAKARTAFAEAENAEKMHAKQASVGTEKWLNACLERGNVLSSEGMLYRMGRIGVLRDAVAKRLMDQDIQAKAEQRRIEEEADLEVLGMTDEEIDAEIADMAELDSRVATAEAESEAMGYDEETMQAFSEQVEQEKQNRKNRHDAIVRNQRNQYASLTSRMQTAQEIEDPDAYAQLEERRNAVEGRLTALGAELVDPNAEVNAKNEARIERATDIATGTTKEQRDAVAAEKREQGNLDLMDAQEYVEQAHPDASDEEKQKLIDQYLSRVEARRQAKETKTNEADVDMEALGKGVEFVTRLSKKFGFDVKLVDADDPRLSGAEGAYDPETNAILLPKNITQSEAVRRVLLHEMTHFSESGKGKYKNLRKALFKLEYGDDNGRLEADIDSKIQTYNKHFEAKKIRGKDGNIRKIDREGAMQELTAEICSKVIEGKEEMIDRLVSDSPSAARQIMDGIRNFINRLRGISDPELDKARRVVKLFERALKKAQNVSGNRGEVQYSAKDKTTTEVAHIKDQIRESQDTLNGMDEVANVTYPDMKGWNAKKRKSWVLDALRDVGYKVDRKGFGVIEFGEKQIDASLEYLDKPEEIAAFLALPRVLKRGVEVHRHEDHKSRGFSTVTIAAPVSIGGVRGNMGAVVKMLGRNLYKTHRVLLPDGSVFSYETEKAEPKPLGGAAENGPHAQSISSATDIVAQDDFGFNRKFSIATLPSEDQIAKEIDAWIDSHQTEMNATKGNDGRSQYPDTSAKSVGVPDAIKREIDTNPIFRSYKKDSNDAQFERAMDKVKKNGYTEEVERLLDADHFTTDDSVEAGALAIAAFESGDIATGLSLMAKDEVNVREAARTMQARQAFAKMTPTHVMAKVGGEMEVKLSDIEKEFGQMANDVKRMAREHDVKIKDLMGGSELDKIAAKGEYTISSKNNKWGIPLNEKQMEMIKQFKLEKVARPGIHYNRATIEQRMLEAIIATPDPDADTGNGRTLTERLEWMKRGKPVGTVADLRYIADNIATYIKLSEIDKNSREARVALGRALEAYGNITPKTLGQKVRTQRYVNMLLSFTSSERNVIGNVGQNVVNAATHDTFGVFTDWATSLVTGKREVMPISIKDRIKGFRAFADGLGEVFKDTFVDQVNASAVDTEDAKFDGGMDGRVFQKAKIPVVGNIPIVGDLITDFAENARNLEGFLMSYGDRSVYKAAFANSIAEQTRLAEEKGIALDWDAAVEQAKKDANYATFNESGELRSALEQLRNKSSLARFFMDLYTPFVGIPLNIAKRGFVEYSPINVLGAVGGALKNAADGRAFDQKSFVDGVSKGLGGTALMLAGAWLKANGYFMPGTGEEDDEKLYNLRASMGEQYSPFIRVGDEYYSLSALAPVIYPITLGATIYDMLTEEDKALGDMAIDAGVALVNQFFDASFMSGLADLFDTSNSSFGENLMKTVPETLMSQMLPYGTALGQWATASDQYVRDTKDASAIRSAFNKSVIARIPEAREMLLPTKNDIAGQPVDSKEGIRNFIDPFYTTKANDDPAFKELDRLYDETGSSSHIPTYLIKTSGKVQILAKIADDDSVNMNRSNNEHKIVLTAKERNHYNQMYSQLVFDGTGDKTYEGIGGIETEFAGIRDVMNSAEYEYASDEEKADMISEVLSMAKLLTQAQIVIDKGYVK